MLLLALLASLSTPAGVRPAPARQAEPDSQGFVELSCERSVLYAGERFALIVRFGLADDPGEGSLVPLFRQELDLPVELQLHSDGCAPVLEPLAVPEAPGGTTLVVDGGLARARPLGDLDRGGRRFRAFELERWFRAASAGSCELAGARLRWATAGRFAPDLLGEAVPLEREERSASAAPLTLEVRPLPEEGRPPGFTGAVGEFALSARAEPRDLPAGGTLRLYVEVSGTGNLRDFELPRAGWPGLPCLGTLEDGTGEARTITYDLRPESTAVREVPALELAFFRPGPEPGYAVATTPAIPILVRPREVSEISDAPPRPPEGGAGPEAPDARPWWLYAAGVVTSALAFAAAFLWLRRSAGADGGPKAGEGERLR
jgi:hypothetical protein